MEAYYPEISGLQSGGLQPSSVVQNDLSFLENKAATEIVLGFRIDDLGFLLPVSLHCEVVERLQVSPIPNVEPWFSGLLNIRGNIVPVIDLRILIGKADSIPKKRYLFAVDRGEKTVALWIDGYPQMLTGMGQLLNDLPKLPDRLHGYVTNAYLHEGQLWLKLQLDQLFKTLGRQHVTKEAES